MLWQGALEAEAVLLWASGDIWPGVHGTRNVLGNGDNKPDRSGGVDGAKDSSGAPVVEVAEDSGLS